MRTILILLLSVTAAAAGDVVTCDPDDETVPHRVIRYQRSVHTPAHEGDPDKIINPDLSAVDGVPGRYWRCSGAGPHAEGEAVIEMTQAEKDAVDAANAPPADPWVVVEAPSGERGGIQARAGEIRIGSRTPDPVRFVFGGATVASMGQGGRWALGVPDGDVLGSDRVVLSGILRLVDDGDPPTCNAARRGSLRFETGGQGVADALQVCMKAANGSFVWVSVPQ